MIDDTMKDKHIVSRAHISSETCLSFDIYIYNIPHVVNLLFNTLVKSLPRVLNNVIPLKLFTSSSLSFLCIGTTYPSLQTSEKWPRSSILLKRLYR